MKHLYIIAIAATALLVGACQSSNKVNTEDKWAAEMQMLKGRFANLLPYVYAKRSFHSPDNEDKIGPQIKALSDATHKISHDTVKELPSKDPGLRFAASRLDSELAVAHETFESGNKEYSRRILKSVVKNCFYCHSQSNAGPRFDDLSVQVNSSELTRSERADLFVATRNFDKALAELESALTDKEYLQANPFEQERALRKYLALSIRVNNNPDKAIALLDNLLENDIKPVYLHDHVLTWQKSLQKWKKELKRSKKRITLKEAKRLVQQAQVEQEFPVDNSGDVYYLRATNLLHDYLGKQPKNKQAVEAFYLLGTSYEVLADIGLWDMSDIYYEACIRQLPHSKMSQRCYKRWEQSMYLGYSGSGGVFIPKSVRVRMSELKDLAKPIKK